MGINELKNQNEVEILDFTKRVTNPYEEKRTFSERGFHFLAWAIFIGVIIHRRHVLKSHGGFSFLRCTDVLYNDLYCKFYFLRF